jgi:hypothetical protein
MRLLHNHLFDRLAQKMESIEDIEYLERHQKQEEAEGMKYARYMFWGAIGLAILLLIFVNIFQVEGQANGRVEQVARPRYTLTSKTASFIFENHESLPFQIISQQCWNDAIGFCDSSMTSGATPLELWIVTDWLTDQQGSIYQLGDTCYWWMYKAELGADGQPHVDEHYWISCP